MTLKNFVLIFIAVLLANLASALLLDSWNNYKNQQEKLLETHKLVEQQKLREMQGAKIRQLLLDAHKQQGRANNDQDPASIDPAENPIKWGQDNFLLGLIFYG